MSGAIERVSEKMSSGASLAPDDVDALWACTDLVSLGLLADERRRTRHGDRTTFVRVAILDCDAPLSGVPAGAGEVRIQGVPASIDGVRSFVEQVVTLAGSVPVTAFSLADLERMAGDGTALTRAVEALLESGVAAVAEAPVDRLAHPRRAVEAVLEAGAWIARFTVHGDGGASPQEAFAEVRRLHKVTGAVRAFAPLPRHGEGGALSTGYDDVKRVAIARLALDHVPTVQVDWTLHGPKLAQVALLFGADDLDAVSPFDEAPHGPRRAPLEEVLRNIRAASLAPVQRDARFAIREP